MNFINHVLVAYVYDDDYGLYIFSIDVIDYKEGMYERDKHWSVNYCQLWHS